MLRMARPTAILLLLAGAAQADTLTQGPYTTNAAVQPITVSLAVPRFAGGMQQLRRVAVQVSESSSYSASVSVPLGSPPTPVSISYTSTLMLSAEGVPLLAAAGATWSGIATTGFNNNIGFTSGSALANSAQETRARSRLQGLAGSGDASFGLQLTGTASCSAACNVSALSSLVTAVTYEFAPDGLFYDTFD